MLNTAATGQSPAATAPRRWRVRVPNSHLGRISGRGKATAYAAQLLFWRAYRAKSRPDFMLTLAEAAKPPTRGGLGMSKRAFTVGVKILVESAVVKRWQPNHREPVREELAPAMKGEGYVGLDPDLIIHGSARLVALVAMVRLNPKPVHARALALGYLDLRHHKTVNVLVEQALAGGHIAGAKVGGRWLVCRPETAATLVKNGDTGLVKNGDAKPVKNGDASIEELAVGKGNGSASIAATASKKSLGTELDTRLVPSDSVEDGSGEAEVRNDGSEDDGALLRQADLAGALARYLLTPGGLHGYRALIAEHGDLALTAITATLSRLAIDGAEPGMVTSWGYFRGAIADEHKLAHLVKHSIRPGDVFNWHRKMDIDGRDWRGPSDDADELLDEFLKKRDTQHEEQRPKRLAVPPLVAAASFQDCDTTAAVPANRLAVACAGRATSPWKRVNPGRAKGSHDARGIAGKPHLTQLTELECHEDCCQKRQSQGSTQGSDRILAGAGDRDLRSHYVT